MQVAGPITGPAAAFMLPRIEITVIIADICFISMMLVLIDRLLLASGGMPAIIAVAVKFLQRRVRGLVAAVAMFIVAIAAA